MPDRLWVAPDVRRVGHLSSRRIRESRRRSIGLMLLRSQRLRAETDDTELRAPDIGVRAAFQDRLVEHCGVLVGAAGRGDRIERHPGVVAPALDAVLKVGG